MKKLILSIGTVLTLVACNEVPQQTASTAPFIQQQVQQPSTDTMGLASFREWKAQNELSEISEYQAKQESYSQPVQRQTTTRKTSTPARKTSSPSTQVEQPSQSSSESTASNTGSGAETGTTPSETGTTTEKKEGWSKAAKGAVIGGVAGAAGGAVVNKKNRVVGAVVGAVIGAGGGYVLGRQQDKKDGRIE